MGYCIEYNPNRNKKYPMHPTKKTKWMPKLLIAVSVVVIGIFILQRNEENDFIKSCLYPGDPDVTAGAFSDMIQNIREGENVGESITDFCKEIIRNG